MRNVHLFSVLCVALFIGKRYFETNGEGSNPNIVYFDRYAALNSVKKEITCHPWLNSIVSTSALNELQGEIFMV